MGSHPAAVLDRRGYAAYALIYRDDLVHPAFLSLSLRAVRVYLYLLTRVSPEHDQERTLPREDIRGALVMDPRAVGRAIAELRTAGMVKTVHQKAPDGGRGWSAYALYRPGGLGVDSTPGLGVDSTPGLGVDSTPGSEDPGSKFPSPVPPTPRERGASPSARSSRAGGTSPRQVAARRKPLADLLAELDQVDLAIADPDTDATTLAEFRARRHTLAGKIVAWRAANGD